MGGGGIGEKGPAAAGVVRMGKEDVWAGTWRMTGEGGWDLGLERRRFITPWGDNDLVRCKPEVGGVITRELSDQSLITLLKYPCLFRGLRNTNIWLSPEIFGW